MASASTRSGKLNRRADILRAAEKLMHTRGLSGVTTRQISREVGCSEGALYVHFSGRVELLLAMLEEGLPDMLGPLHTLRESVGQGSPHTNFTSALFRKLPGCLRNQSCWPPTAVPSRVRAKGRICR